MRGQEKEENGGKVTGRAPMVSELMDVKAAVSRAELSGWPTTQKKNKRGAR